MRLGLWGARADDGGLGTQTWEFYNHFKPQKTLVVDLQDRNKDFGLGYKPHLDRYPDAIISNDFPTKKQMEELLNDLDIVMCIEIPYGYEFFTLARERGIKTALQPNFEFFDYFQDRTLPKPDWFI